ncbi:MAG: hypothetical protein O7D93_03260, partial [Acidobacteria bacterium]|nr:hypothetical protein [Acidobacteriota bacterium]
MAITDSLPYQGYLSQYPGGKAGVLSCVGGTCAKAPQVPNPQTNPGHCLLRYVITTRDLRSP